MRFALIKRHRRERKARANVVFRYIRPHETILTMIAVTALVATVFAALSP